MDSPPFPRSSISSASFPRLVASLVRSFGQGPDPTPFARPASLRSDVYTARESLELFYSTCIQASTESRDSQRKSAVNRRLEFEAARVLDLRLDGREADADRLDTFLDMIRDGMRYYPESSFGERPTVLAADVADKTAKPLSSTDDILGVLFGLARTQQIVQGKVGSQFELNPASGAAQTAAVKALFERPDKRDSGFFTPFRLPDLPPLLPTGSHDVLLGALFSRPDPHSTTTGLPRLKLPSLPRTPLDVMERRAKMEVDRQWIANGLMGSREREEPTSRGIDKVEREPSIWIAAAEPGESHPLPSWDDHRTSTPTPVRQFLSLLPPRPNESALRAHFTHRFDAGVWDNVLSAGQFAQSVENLVLGVGSEAFMWLWTDGRWGRFEVSEEWTGVRCEGWTVQAAERFLRPLVLLGTVHRRLLDLRDYLSLSSPTRVLATLADHLSNRLASVRRELVSTVTDTARRTGTITAPLLELARRCRPVLVDLRNICASWGVPDSLTPSEPFSEIPRQILDPHHVLISRAYDRAKGMQAVADTGAEESVELLQLLAEEWMRRCARWLGGHGDDHEHEGSSSFFVRYASEGWRDAQADGLGQIEYIADGSRVPSFLPISLAARLFRAGKAIRLIRERIPEHPLANARAEIFETFSFAVDVDGLEGYEQRARDNLRERAGEISAWQLVAYEAGRKAANARKAERKAARKQTRFREARDRERREDAIREEVERKERQRGIITEFLSERARQRAAEGASASQQDENQAALDSSRALIEAQLREQLLAEHDGRMRKLENEEQRAEWRRKRWATQEDRLKALAVDEWSEDGGSGQPPEGPPSLQGTLAQSLDQEPASVTEGTALSVNAGVEVCSESSPLSPSSPVSAQNISTPSSSPQPPRSPVRPDEVSTEDTKQTAWELTSEVDRGPNVDNAPIDVTTESHGPPADAYIRPAPTQTPAAEPARVTFQSEPGDDGPLSRPSHKPRLPDSTPTDVSQFFRVPELGEEYPTSHRRETLLPVDLVTSLLLHRTLRAQCRLIERSSLDVFLHHLDVDRHLELVRSRFLMGDGVFVGALKEAIFQGVLPAARRAALGNPGSTVWPPQTAEVTRWLVNVLDTDGLDWQFDLEVAGRGGIDALTSIDVLSFLKLQLDLPAPLSTTLFDPSVLKKYNYVFSFLLLLLVSDNAANRLASRRARFGTGEEALLYQMRMFVKAFGAYIQHSVVGRSWSVFTGKLRQARRQMLDGGDCPSELTADWLWGDHTDREEDVPGEGKWEGGATLAALDSLHPSSPPPASVTQLYRLHHTCLDLMMSGCFLGHRYQPLRAILLNLLDIVVKASHAVTEPAANEAPSTAEAKIDGLTADWKTSTRIFFDVPRALLQRRHIANTLERTMLEEMVELLDSMGWYTRG